MRQLMVARVFPGEHPHKGEQTYFVEKIWQSIYIDQAGSKFFDNLLAADIFDISQHAKYDPKHHTIRAGKRWKTGDMVQLKVWSGKPYRSKTITITPPLELTVYDIEIRHYIHPDYDSYEILINNTHFCYMLPGDKKFELLAKNDGLTPQEMFDWFIPKPAKFSGFSGQILCWNPDIKY